MNKLTKYQKAVSDTKFDQVVLRWGRRVGKNYLIDHISGKKDIVMYPTFGMAKAEHSHLDYRGRTPKGAQCISDPRQLLGFKPDKLFVVEPAYHDDLYEVLHYVRKVKPRKVYLIGTPEPSDDVLSSAFLFNAITREADALKSDKIFFSLVGASDAPHINKEMLKEWKESFPDNTYIMEIDAHFEKGK